jgi:hypothetical protein
VLQKEPQVFSTCSHHGASPALNIFQWSAWMPLQIHPPNIFPRNFLLAEIADGWINLVPYSSFMTVTIFNLAYGVQWHGFSLRGLWNLRGLYTLAHVCTSTEVIHRARGARDQRTMDLRGRAWEKGRLGV